jgi:hypothetical protein
MDNTVNANLKLITQIGLVVKDLKKAVAGMERIFGVLPDGYEVQPEQADRRLP